MCPCVLPLHGQTERGQDFLHGVEILRVGSVASRQVGLADRLVINAVIYYELSMAFARIEELEAVVNEASLTLEAIPREALFLAGKVFLDYRRRKGSKQHVLPDFYIGAHAAVNGYPILTRDVARYRSYFPTVRLIAPEQA